MKTKQEIKEEIIELYAAQKAYSEIVEFAHKQRVDAMKKKKNDGIESNVERHG